MQLQPWRRSLTSLDAGRGGEGKKKSVERAPGFAFRLGLCLLDCLATQPQVREQVQASFKMTCACSVANGCDGATSSLHCVWAMRLREQEAAFRRLSAWAKKLGREDWVDSDREGKKHRERNRARDHESESGRGLEEGNRAHSHGLLENDASGRSGPLEIHVSNLLRVWHPLVISHTC